MCFNKEQLNIRAAQKKDYPQICQLVKNQEELFYCFTKATFPLTESILEEGLLKRADVKAISAKGSFLVGIVSPYIFI